MPQQFAACFASWQVPGELYFPLAPCALRTTRQEGERGDMVIAELSNWLLVCVNEEQLGAVVIHLCDRLKRLVAHDRSDLVEQLVRNLVFAVDGLTEFCADLSATFRTGNLDVPAIIISAGATSQRDLRVGKAEVLGVVVNRGQRVVAGFCNTGNLIEVGEIRHGGGLIHGELGFDFKERLWRHVHTFVGERIDKKEASNLGTAF